MSIVFFDGKFIAEEQTFIPISDRGFLFGDGVFATIKVNDGFPEYALEHIQKLYNQCREIGITPPQIDASWLSELVKKNKAFQGIWRLKIIVTGGNTEELYLPNRPYGHLVMIIKPYSFRNLSSYHLTVFPEAFSKPLASIKSLSYLDRLYLKNYAEKEGYDEVLTKSPEGFILETAFSNIFWRIDNDFYTPDVTLPIHFGVTIALIVKMMAKHHFHVHYTKKKIFEIPKEAQVYICNAMKGICPINSIDDQLFSLDPTFETFLRIDLFRNC